MSLGYPLQLTRDIRLDRGPRTLWAVATEDLLTSGKLAAHYRVGGMDAFGKKIRLGESFSYVDWNAPLDQHVYTLYQRETSTGRYLILDRYDTEEEALSAADLLGV